MKVLLLYSSKSVWKSSFTYYTVACRSASKSLYCNKSIWKSAWKRSYTKVEVFGRVLILVQQKCLEEFYIEVEVFRRFLHCRSVWKSSNIVVEVFGRV